MNIFKKVSLVSLVLAFAFGITGLINAATAVNLGTADNFAILSGSTITNTGASVINGDLGLSPGTSVTGFPPGTVNGTQYIADAIATQAKTSLITAYNNAAGQTPVSTLPTELGGSTLVAGVYDSAAGTFSITGTLTLDGQGDPNAIFTFKTASTLITAGSSNVSLINGAQACNVFWQVGSSATLGTNSTFKGNILALTSVTLTTGANVEGRVLARNGAVTLDTNTITKATCVIPTTPPPPPATTSTPTTPPPASTSTPTPPPTSTPVLTPTSTPPVISAPSSTTPIVTPASVPNLPSTGYGPNPRNTFFFLGILALGLISLAVQTFKKFKA